MVTPQQCLDKFGEPRLEKNLAVLQIPEHIKDACPALKKQGKIYCNKLMHEPILKAFENLLEANLLLELETWDGCFNIRVQRRASAMSLHSWGVAFDVNRATNELGEAPSLSPEFVKCVTDAGFDWGGRWKRLDGMHFQLSSLD